MRKFLGLFLAICLPLLLFGQVQTTKIHGFIYERDTNRPLPDVEVNVYSDSTINPNYQFATFIKTSEDGRFEFDAPVPNGNGAYLFFTVLDCSGEVLMQEAFLGASGEVNGLPVEFFMCKDEKDCFADFFFEPVFNSPYTFRFVNKSHGPFTGVEWKISDGSYYTDYEITHVFPGPGSYVVGLKIFDDINECVDSTLRDIFIPEADSSCRVSFNFYPDELDPFLVRFDGFGSPDVEYWAWEFGDGTSGEGQNVEHKFPQDGEYEVCLVGMTKDSCESRFCERIRVPFDNVSGCRVKFDYVEEEDKKIAFQSYIEPFTANANYVYEWHFGDGTGSGAANPVHAFPEYGGYEVCLTIYDETGGCQDVRCEFIIISNDNTDECFADFAYEVKYADDPFTFKFDNTSEGSYTAQEWHFIGFDVRNEAEPEFTFPGDGIYHVGLLIFNDNWTCWDSVVQEIIVGTGRPDCHSDIHFYPDEFDGMKVFFEGHSPNAINTWEWSFGDGAEMRGREVEYVFPGRGEYEVCLRTVDNFECVSETCIRVAVPFGEEPPDCEIYFDVEDLGDKTHLFTAFLEKRGDDPNEEFVVYWDFGDGNTARGIEVEHTFDTYGLYDICVSTRSSDGCEAKTCEKIIIGRENTEGCEADFTFDVDETNNRFTYSFTNTSTGNYTGFEWVFDNLAKSFEDNPSFTFPGYGEYGVGILIYNDDWTCWDSAVAFIQIGGETGECLNSIEIFPDRVDRMRVKFEGQSSSPIKEWKWNFGDNTFGQGRFVDHHYREEGEYEVCLQTIDETGCEAFHCVLVRVPTRDEDELCQVDFTSEELGDKTWKFSAYTDNPDASRNYAYEWNFGDGTRGSGKDIEHVYERFGVYEVCIGVYDDLGCQATECEIIVVGRENTLGCVADFGFEIDEEDPYTYSFDNLSSGDYSTVRWYFDDIEKREEEAPVFRFPGDGLFHVGLLVYNDDWSCWDSTVQEIEVGRGEPEPDCYVDIRFRADASNGLKLYFEGNSPGRIIDWKWDFGDSTFARGQFTSHKYEQPGEYEICVLALGENGCEATHCIQVRVPIVYGEPECEAMFVSKEVEPMTFQFFNESRWKNVLEAPSFMWDFGDGNTSTNSNPRYRYAEPGAYEVSLLLETEGCESSYYTILIAAADTNFNCEADWSYEPDRNDPLTLTFTNLSRGDFTKWQWHFGDGEQSEEESPTHTYPGPGLYFGGLLVYNEEWSCWDSLAMTINVGDFEPPKECRIAVEMKRDQNLDMGVLLIGSSEDPIEQWLWDFGDGNTAEGDTVAHIFSQAGTYEVCLKVIGRDGECENKRCERIRVPFEEIVDCKADFKPVSLGEGVFYFDNESRWVSGNNQLPSYRWSFGDGSSSQDESPLHRFTQNGTYLVRMGMATNDNCIDTVSRVIRVTDIEDNSRCRAKFHYFADGDNSGKTIHFISDVDTDLDSSGYAFDWQFGDGAGSGLENPSHVFPGAGTYTTCLTVTTPDGCTNTYCEAIFIEETIGLGEHTVSGKVYIGDDYPDELTVYLVTLDIYTQYLYAVDSVSLSVASYDSAYYVFENVPTGFYLTKAALNPSSTYYDRYVPTYFGEKVFWVEANFIPVFTDRVDSDIHMVEAENPGGPGFISGNIFQGANKLDVGASSVQLMLLDEEGNVIAYTFSNADGSFEFDDVPFGTYTVIGEMINMEADPVVTTIDDENPSSDDVGLEIVESLITGIKSEPQPDRFGIGKVYPQPTRNTAWIDIEIKERSKFHLQLLNSLGQVVYDSENMFSRGPHRLQLDLKQLPTGVYNLSITVNGMYQTIRKVVKY